MIVKRVFASFGYEQLLIYCYCENTPHSLRVTEVPRDFVKALEDELYSKSGMHRDNKCGFIFESDGDTYAVSFWDFKATFVRWSGQHWEGVPANVSLCKGWRDKRHHATREELGLPTREAWFD